MEQNVARTILQMYVCVCVCVYVCVFTNLPCAQDRKFIDKEIILIFKI